jgi:hypothetical protein
MTIRKPAKADFTVTYGDGGVRVLFKPTESEYNFQLIADPADIAKHGPISSSYDVRHAKTGDTGEYDSNDIAEMAIRLAREAAHKK